MEANTKKVIKWFWGWEDDKEEAWLREMAQQGWHLKSLGLPGNYTFEKGEPKDMVYRLDYKSAWKQEPVEYLQLFQDAGWEHVGSNSGWHYFRMPMQGEDAPEIYTDVESKIQKYQRFLSVIAVFFPIFIILVINRPEITRTSAFTVFDVFLVFLIILELFFIYAVINLIRRIQELKKMK